MGRDYAVETGDGEMRYRCGACDWMGGESEIDAWAVHVDHDRAVRQCPNCDEPGLEWGALRGLDALERIAHGPLREALVEEGVIED